MPRQSVFRFKQFNVLNDKVSMKVGTDGVLLGSWCTVNKAKRVLDVGTGCGVIALMIAQRNPDAIIDAIDIDEAGIGECKLNFAASQWANRLNAQCTDFCDFSNDGIKYDLIVSNPPFFTNGVLSPSKHRQEARHAIRLTLDNLLHKSSKLLNDFGIISLVLPYAALEDLKNCCATLGLSISKLTNVFTLRGHDAKRILVELAQQRSECHTYELVIEEKAGSFTKQYVDLTKEFYLNM